METFILIIIGVVGILLGFTLGRAGSHRHISSFVNKERYPLKDRRKRMLLKHLGDRERLTNDEAQKLLGVSDSTITTYFDELEEEGEVVQVGETGRGVYYTLT
ncbi:winged helix-turn-helix domain-containing protein [candidate division KSB1 bacterium]